LAAMLKISDKRDPEEIGHQELVAQACKLFEQARKTIALKDSQLAAIEDGVFKLPDAEWRKLISEFTGDFEDVNELLRRKIPRADALKKLFPAHTEDEQSREVKLRQIMGDGFPREQIWNISTCRGVACKKLSTLSEKRRSAALAKKVKKNPSTKSLLKFQTKKAA
jgi:hypothetical protein